VAEDGSAEEVEEVLVVILEVVEVVGPHTWPTYNQELIVTRKVHQIQILSVQVVARNTMVMVMVVDRVTVQACKQQMGL